MAGIEFHLGRSDHRVVEDFLGSHPSGVAGITVDAKNVELQGVAIEAAHAQDLEVHVDPLTERLVAPGFTLGSLDYGIEMPLDPAQDLSSTAARDEFVARVVEPQYEVATTITPPHFFVERDDVLDLNLSLLRRTMSEYGDQRSVEPILAAQRAFLAFPGRADLVAHRYRHEGITRINLRLSPLGGEDEGVRKIASALEIVEAFQAAGVNVVLGHQGALGEVAIALGLTDGFSVGIGYRERVDHKAAVNRQRRLVKKSDARARGVVGGVYLPSAGITVPRKLGRALYRESSLRSRLACTIGECASSIEGPTLDPRGHYLHARANDVATVISRPAPWRPKLVRDRLVEAMETRKTINRHLPEETHPLKLRTLKSLIQEIDGRVDAAA